MSKPHQNLDALKSEGDINLTSHRAAWSAANIDGESAALLTEDSKYFLHQSLSTPCLDVLESCGGASIPTASGREMLDFHGNNVHQVGFANPRVIEAMIEQMRTLAFCTRRYTNVPAIAL